MKSQKKKKESNKVRLTTYQPTRSPEQLPVDGSLVGEILSQNKASLVLVYQVAGIALIFDLTTVIDDLRVIAKGCESSSCWKTGRTLRVRSIKKKIYCFSLNNVYIL